MPAYLLLIVAVLSRLVPHAPWFNFTAVGGSLLYFGARRSWREMLVPMAALMATDYVLTVFYYHYSFAASFSLIAVSWLWYAAAMVLGRILLHDRTTFARVAAAVVLGPTTFFLVSNFEAWIGGPMYPHTAAGLAACYTAALPFYANDLLATGIVAGLAFGVPVLLRRFAPAEARISAVK